MSNSLAESTGDLVVAGSQPFQMPAANPADVSTRNTLEYTIAKGDTFASLAKRFHVSVKAIIQANPAIEPTRLRIGQKLQIPQTTVLPVGNAATTSVEGTNGENVYTVKSGDTLIKIASLFGTNPKAIRENNRLSTDRINVGQTLKIPVKTTSQIPASSAQSHSGQTNTTPLSASNP